MYRQKWERGLFRSLLGCIRDVIILALPFKKIPKAIVKLIYGNDAQFAFLVHPRTYQDIFISAPFLKPVKFFLRKNVAYRLISKMPPFVLNTVQTEHKVNGFVLAQLTVPEIMFEQKRETLEMLKRCLKLVSKITENDTFVGLGGWFPMVSRRGASLEEYAKLLGLSVTSGHCGTLASIFMMVEKIAEIGHLPIAKMTLSILGVGKMGGSVAKAFDGKVRKLILIDVNQGNITRIKEQLDKSKNNTEIESVVSTSENIDLLRRALKKSHIGICATATFRNLLKLRDMPPGFIAIDDSRPEALPRDPKKERLVLEGGLLKIKGAKINYNYGFGQDDNVFGCLGEAFLLAINKVRDLNVTIGDVEMNNFFRVLSFCKENGVSVGDLKSGENFVTNDDIINALHLRGLLDEKQKIYTT